MNGRQLVLPLVTVVIPCFNSESTVSETISSLLSQQFKGLEILCIDDGSSDGTGALLDQIALRYPEVDVIHQVNSGAWSARLSGIEHAAGDYIMFVDSDDVVKDGFLNKMYNFAVSSNTDIAVCGFNRVDATSGKVMSEEFCTPLPAFTIRNDPGRLLQVNPAPWNKIFRSSLLKSINRISCSPVMLDDLSLFLLAALNSAKDIAFLPEPLIDYRVHSDSTINTMSAKQLGGAIDALKEIRAFYSSAKVPSLLECFDSIAFSHLGVSMSFRLLGSSEDDSTSTINHLFSVLDRDFPLWRNSRYLSIFYAFSHGGIYLKACAAALFAKLGLFSSALRAYRILKKSIGRDICW